MVPMSKAAKSSLASALSRPTTTMKRSRSLGNVRPGTRSRSANWLATPERAVLENQITKGSERWLRESACQGPDQAGREEGKCAPPTARRQGRRRECRARTDRRDAGVRSRPGRAVPCNRQSQRQPSLRDSGTGCLPMPTAAGSSASSKARRSSRRGTRRSASCTRRTSTTAPCGRRPSRSWS